MFTQTDPISSLDQTLRLHLPPSAEDDPQRSYTRLIAAARAVSDRLIDGQPYQFDRGGVITVGDEIALHNLISHTSKRPLEVRAVSCAKPYEPPRWMSGNAFYESIRRSYSTTLAEQIRRRYDRNEWMRTKSPHYRLVRVTVEIALKDRLDTAFRRSSRGEQPRGLPESTINDLTENVLETFAFGLTISLKGPDNPGRLDAPDFVKLAEIFKNTIPLGASTFSDDSWLTITA